MTPRPAASLLVLALAGAPASALAGPGGSQPKEPAPPPAASPQVKAFLAGWSKRMAGVHTLRVAFTQRKTMRILRRPLVSKGVTLLVGRRVLMKTYDRRGALETEVLVRKGEARVLYPQLKRLEVYPLAAGAPPPTPFPLFGADLEDLPRTYRLTLVTHGARRTLTLVPRAPDSPLAETRMTFDADYEITEVVQRDRHGGEVRLEITSFERNPDLKGQRLDLDVPPGTETIYPLGH